MEHVFIPITFVQTDEAGDKLDKSDWGKIARYNRILGSVRMQQTRSRPTSFWLNDTMESRLLAQRVRYLEARHWIDRQTDFVELVISLYNGELSVFTEAVLTLQIERGGFIDNEFSISSIVLDPYKLSPAPAYLSDAGWLVCLLIFTLITLSSVPDVLLALIVETFAAAANDIFHFVLVFLTIVFCFASSGTLLFGHEVTGFSSVGVSFMTCFELL
ncbi:hypothetical protein GUITHDRAFT_73293, partial [Guillardia theta CCMP2712]